MIQIGINAISTLETGNQIENLTVIEFSSEALRSIDVTVSISAFQTKFDKEINRIMQSKILNLEIKEKK
jgi:hypothetical protein